jgi:hypothetical protein
MKKRTSATLMRETLESIRDRFVADEQRMVLFTTFNFVPSFFEANVLPLLAGEAAEDLKNAPQLRYGLNAELKHLRCLVVCDHSTQPPAKGNLRYGLMPVGLPNGRFHPKLMLMAGTLKETGRAGMWLAVGSGNLSLSGWAINREVVGATPVTPQHADELLPLLRWLTAQADRRLGGRAADEEGSPRAILDELVAWLDDPQRLCPAWPGAPTLHVAPPAGGGHGLAAAVRGARQWQRATVVSPYWGQVDALVRELGVRECRFVPSLVAGRYRFPVTSMDPQAEWKRGFASFGDDRYTHAKVLVLEDADGRAVLCVGSANFTGAALGLPGGYANVEAVLRYELETAPAQWASLPSVDESLLADESAAEEESAPPLPPFEATLYYDWKRKGFGGRIAPGPGASLPELVLHVAGLDRPLGDKTGEAEELFLSFECRLPVRSFELSWCRADGSRARFHGLVTQVGANDDQLQYRPRPRLEEVLAFLRDLDPGAGEEELRRRGERGEGGSGGDGDEEEREPLFDYFGLFQGTWKLRAYYRSTRRAMLGAVAFDPSSRFSVTTLYRAIALQPANTPEERISHYVYLSEVRALIDWLRAQGVEPDREGELAGVGEEIDGMRSMLAGMLADSPSFTSMFGADPVPEKVEAFLDWFHQEIKDEGQSRGG